MKAKTRSVSFNELFKDKHFFFTAIRKKKKAKKGSLLSLGSYPRSSPYTYSGRYPNHSFFLKKNRAIIKVFSDIGCSLSKGAPTTVDAKNALGENSKVYGVDITKVDQRLSSELPKKGVTPLKHSITNSPLPFECDAIRFANVSGYMTQSDRRKSIVNIWKSLKKGGFLLGATILPNLKEHEFILRKTEKGFELISESQK